MDRRDVESHQVTGPSPLAMLPSDTKLLLTKNYSEIIIFGKITNLTRNSLKMSFFPGHFESSKPLTNYEK